jgi:hypothetical protein
MLEKPSGQSKESKKTRTLLALQEGRRAKKVDALWTQHLLSTALLNVRLWLGIAWTMNVAGPRRSMHKYVGAKVPRRL